MSVGLGLSFLSGCGSGSQTTPPADVTGRWVRSVNVPGSALSMTLQESGNQISGSGNYAVEAGRSGALQVKGSVSGTRTNLTLTYDIDTVFTFEGQLTDTTHLSGQLQSPGSPANTITFVKQ